MKKSEDKYVAFIKLYMKLHYWGGGGKLIARTLYFLNRFIFSCDIPPTVKIGKHLHLPHYGLGVVIHPCTQIGDNVTIYQQVTIGARNGQWNTIIGDGVFIGAGVKILGNIKIGDNVKVGANSVVLDDVPPNCTAVGIPARVIKNDR